MCSITCTQLRVETRLQLLSAWLPHSLPACLACLKLPPGCMSNSRYLLQRESAPLLPWRRGGKAKTIDRQFPYEMKINMTFLGLCTFVQQLVSLTRLGCLGQNLIPLNRDPPPHTPHLAVTAIKCHLLLWQGSTGADCA